MLINTKKPRLSIWFIHDHKPGHIHQLQGLEERIASYCKIDSRWIDYNGTKLSWLNFFISKRKINSTPDTPPPDIIIGAGHKTHKALLIYTHIYKAYSVVIMKPSLPLACFDAVICPAHDKLKDSKRVMNTLGALNSVIPTKNITTKTSSLMLIGGPSKHFKWQEEDLLKQIKIICAENSTLQWLICDSPRTPNSFLQTLKKLKLQNLNYYHHQDTNPPSLHQRMLTSAITWVTPDSVSMVYESLTAHTPTYTFSMPLQNTAKPSRVAKAINNLIGGRHVISFENWQLHTDIKPNKLDLWEADRAAKWLLNRYFETHPHKKDA